MSLLFFFFFFNDTATTEIYTLSLHDALPISTSAGDEGSPVAGRPAALDRTNGSRPRRPRRARGGVAGERRPGRAVAGGDHAAHRGGAFGVGSVDRRADRGAGGGLDADDCARRGG